MAFLKAKTHVSPGFLIFTDAPVAIGTAQSVPVPVEFVVSEVSPAKQPPLIIYEPRQSTNKQGKRQIVLDDQLSLLEFTA
jgi:hypothetical protein